MYGAAPNNAFTDPDHLLLAFLSPCPDKQSPLNYIFIFTKLYCVCLDFFFFFCLIWPMNICGINYPTYGKPGDVGLQPGKMHACHTNHPSYIKQPTTQGLEACRLLVLKLLFLLLSFFYFSCLEYIHSLHPARSAFMRN